MFGLKSVNVRTMIVLNFLFARENVCQQSIEQITLELPSFFHLLFDTMT